MKKGVNASKPTSSWRQDFSYDRYGNRNFVEGNTTFEGFDKLCANNTELCAELRKVLNPSANASDNRLSSSDGYVFDPAGNTVRDPQSRRFTYDGENKQVKVETLDLNGNPVATVGEYVYDGDGKRVKKHVPSTGEVTVFVYDAGGKLIGEYSTNIETAAPKVQYLTADHLGSPRILTDENGATISRRDFMPYGEEIARTAYGSDTVRKQFTGYERDSETELDFAQARMYPSGLGRFTSPDPYNVILEKERGDDEDERVEILIGFISNPQRWNMYVYVVNNPQAFTDPDGLKPRTINVFLSTDPKGWTPEQLKQWQDWAAAAQKNDKELTINIYLISKHTPATVNAFLESLKAKDTATIFMGHSAGRRDDGVKIGIHFDDAANLGRRGVRGVTHSADGVDIQNSVVGIFSCDFGDGFKNLTSSNGAAFVSIIQGTQKGAHGTTSANAVNASAFAFTQAIASGSWEIVAFQSTLDVARSRGQSGINANPHPDPNVNAGDYVGQRNLLPPRKKNR